MSDPEHHSSTSRLSVCQLIAGGIGNTMEWYDFAGYGYLATVIGAQFFPTADGVSGVLAAFGVFAVGFLMRPIGALVFGHLGDRIGRKHALILSVISMALLVKLTGNHEAGAIYLSLAAVISLLTLFTMREHAGKAMA